MKEIKWGRTIDTCGSSNSTQYEGPAELATPAATYGPHPKQAKLDIECTSVGHTDAHPIQDVGVQNDK